MWVDVCVDEGVTSMMHDDLLGQTEAQSRPPVLLRVPRSDVRERHEQMLLHIHRDATAAVHHHDGHQAVVDQLAALLRRVGRCGGVRT